MILVIIKFFIRNVCSIVLCNLTVYYQKTVF